MKKLIVLALIAFPLFASAQDVMTVTVDSAGHLLKQITEAKMYKISDLTVKGQINGSDLSVIQTIASRNKVKSDTTVLLKKLDLTDAVIVEGKDGMKTKAGELPDKMFSGCKSLETIALPNTLVSIGDNAFDGCKNLVVVTIPGSVKMIGASAFSGCKAIRELSLPQSLSQIGKHAFDGCEGLTQWIFLHR